MNRIKFKYRKKESEEEKEYNVIVTTKGPSHFAGFDLNKLTEEEAEELKNIQKEYEQKLKPYFKAYRQFIKENVVENIDQEVLSD